MRKFWIILPLFCFFMCGCSTNESLVISNMSDLRVNYFYGKGQDYFCTLSCGYREEPFAYDGISHKSVECGVLTVGFYDICSYQKISVELTVDGTVNIYELEHSPYEELYMADLEYIMSKSSTVSIRLKNANEDVALIELSDSFKIDYNSAIKIGVKYYKNTIENLYFNNKLNAECYLKITQKEGFDKLFWYFSIIDISGNIHLCLIDVNTGQVFAN